MQKTFLSTYSVHVREVRSTLDEPVDKFNGTDDLIDVIGLYLDERSNSAYRNDEVHKVQIVLQHARQGRYIHGAMRAGDFGFASDICDAKNLALRYKKRTQDVELIPLYFQFYVPKGKDAAYLVVQKLGNRSVYSGLRSDLEGYFSGLFPEHRLHFVTAVTEEMLREMLGGEALKIVLRSPTAPRDIADRLPDPKRARANIKSSVVLDIKPEMRTALKQIISRLMDGAIPLNRIFEIDGFDFDDVQIKVDHPEYGTKSISRSRLLAFRSDQDITDRVEYDDDGHPKFNDIKKVATEIMAVIAKRA
jgi:hypothetical protein